MSSELIAAAILAINAKESESASLQELVHITRAVALQLRGEGSRSGPAPTKTEQEQLVGIKLRGFKKIEVPREYIKRPGALNDNLRELLRAFVYISNNRNTRVDPSAWEGHSMLLNYLFTREGVSFVSEMVEKE